MTMAYRIREQGTIPQLIGRILFFIAAAFACLVFSFVVTWIAWHLQITEKAFHCTDDNVSGFWCEIDSHRAAGDTVLQGWTWEKLRMVRLIYEVVFYLIWLGPSAAFFMLIFRRHISETGDNTVLKSVSPIDLLPEPDPSRFKFLRFKIDQ